MMNPIEAAIRQYCGGWPEYAEGRKGNQQFNLRGTFANSNVWVAIFTGCLVICGGIGFWATKRAADATLDYAKTTNEMMHRQLRAYIAVFELHPLGQDHDGVYTTKVIFKNLGQTPARNVQISTHCASTPFPYHGDFTEFTFPTDEQSSAFLPQGRTLSSYELSEKLPLDFSYEVLGDKSALWIFGKVTYQDVFDEWHQLNFRFYLVITVVSGEIHADYATHSFGNDEIQLPGPPQDRK